MERTSEQQQQQQRRHTWSNTDPWRTAWRSFGFFDRISRRSNCVRSTIASMLRKTAEGWEGVMYEGLATALIGKQAGRRGYPFHSLREIRLPPSPPPSPRATPPLHSQRRKLFQRKYLFSTGDRSTLSFVTTAARLSTLKNGRSTVRSVWMRWVGGDELEGETHLRPRR